jgi:hypothetical protein
VRPAKLDEVGLAYQVVSATMTGNGALATPGILCPARVGGPAHVGGDKGTGVHIICRNGLTEFEISHVDDTGSWVRFDTNTKDRLNVQSKALSGQLEAIALELSPDASGVGHISTGFGYRYMLAPGKDLCFAKPRCDRVRLYVHGKAPRWVKEHSVPALPAGGEGGAIEVLELQSGDLVSGGNASVRSDVGDAPVSVQKDLKAIALPKEHRLTHLLRNPWCRAGQRAQVCAKRAAGKATKATRLAEIRVFGDLVAEDHLVKQEQCQCRYRFESFGMVILGHATTWVECHLACEKSAVGAALTLGRSHGRQLACEKPAVGAALTLGRSHGTQRIGEPVKASPSCANSAVGPALALERFLGRHTRSGCVRDHAPELEGDNACKLWHGNGHSRGHTVRFGSLADFRPTKVLLK